ncbi:hypothetical protein FIU87_13590 [Bacillus sp. THAF10]|uniref:hypothetical protein n=1 Tax=Bacillus sp. THAF10 TaxID=2587848 RepID=UPI0012A8438D|nr:hypothetical protein [Bacillus sp. THAF10]QFT89689.1 hypothetical protein FIU87_13590 [Bacillus sp. THAF10]
MARNAEASRLEIAKRLIDLKVTNDLDIISSVVKVCKEDVISYITQQKNTCERDHR